MKWTLYHRTDKRRKPVPNEVITGKLNARIWLDIEKETAVYAKNRYNERIYPDNYNSTIASIVTFFKD